MTLLYALLAGVTLAMGVAVYRVWSLGEALKAAGRELEIVRLDVERCRAPADRDDDLQRLDVWMRQLMMSADHPDTFHELACAAILDLSGADTAAMAQLAGPPHGYYYVAAVGEEADALTASRHRFSPEGMFAWAAAHQEPLRVDDTAVANRRVPAHIAALQANAAIVVPVVGHDRVHAFLTAHRARVPFKDGEQQLLLLFAQKVAIALRNMQLMATLEAEKERAEVTLHSIGDAVITTDGAGRVQYLNPVAERLTGWTTVEARGVDVDDVFVVINEVTRQPVDGPVGRALRQGTVVGIASQSALVRRDGREFSVDDSAAPIRERDGRIVGAVLVFHDVSRARRLARELTWQATHDVLTGLANRAHFEESLRLAVDTAREHDHEHVALYIDLDQFKVVNDTCGHVAGDELLKQLSKLLQAQVRDLDTLARLGGDEFGLLLVGCPLEEGRRIAEKLRETVRDFRFTWEGQTFEVASSVGLATIGPNTPSAASVLSAADMACHVAKEEGRNRVHVFTDGDVGLAQRQGEMMWVSKIAKALEEDRFVLWAQPIVPTGASSHSVTGGHHLEILVRMVDEDGGIVPPGAFIPAAERYNLMGEIDRWVVRNVFERFAGLRGSSDREIPMCAINLSGASMSDETLLPYIRGQFDAWGVPPDSVCFEITETAAVANLTRATQFISALKEMGCRFALDDFGSGLSSFAYLKNLPVDYIKIDGSFVKDMLQQPMNHAIVVAIQGIGAVMGMETIAEFVEDQATLEALTQIGVDFGQGYGIKRPVPLEELLAPEANPATPSAAGFAA